jgi:sortase A
MTGVSERSLVILDIMKRPTLRQTNNGLSLIVIGLSLYVLLAPLWPQAQLRVQSDPPLAAAEKQHKSVVPPRQNTLVIPRIKFQQAIYESPSGYPALNKGVWRRPGVRPGQGKNTVLIGHRFTYGGPAVFYHLDKVRVGDKVVVYWKQQAYRYEVRGILEVPPSATWIEKPDLGNELLTIFTCTPLLTAKNRLVIQAEMSVGQPL